MTYCMSQFFKTCFGSDVRNTTPCQSLSDYHFWHIWWKKKSQHQLVSPVYPKMKKTSINQRAVCPMPRLLLYLRRRNRYTGEREKNHTFQGSNKAVALKFENSVYHCRSSRGISPTSDYSHTKNVILLAFKTSWVSKVINWGIEKNEFD